ncbi:MAG: GTPase ObgE [Balneolaceae bacterium]
MKFADYAKIYVTAGDGGAGMTHFRREKFVPKGGPDGGDGGKGGDVILVGNEQLNTILDLRYRKFIKADAGRPGEGGKRKGKDGKNVILDVPPGTVAFDAETRERLGEITAGGEHLIIARGGRGGLGNWHFRSSTNQTPEHSQPGTSGEERVVELELKLIADVGLVGFPNAGKSTLLSVLSAARPKVADYPFTTLEPNLGVVSFSDYRSFVMADIPGIIEDAHEGRGLGLQFLRHIERNRLLLFLVSSQADIRHEYEQLLHELRSYRPDLLDKPRILVVTKMDLLEGYELDQEISFEKDLPVLHISAATGYQIDELKESIWTLLREIDEDSDETAP